MSSENTAVGRPEFDNLRSDVRELRDGMVRIDTRQDMQDRSIEGLSARIDNLETSIQNGFAKIGVDIRELRNLRTWVMLGVATGGSAIGSAIWHAIQTAAGHLH